MSEAQRDKAADAVESVAEGQEQQASTTDAEATANRLLSEAAFTPNTSISGDAANRMMTTMFERGILPTLIATDSTTAGNTVKAQDQNGDSAISKDELTRRMNDTSLTPLDRFKAKFLHAKFDDISALGTRNPNGITADQIQKFSEQQRTMRESLIAGPNHLGPRVNALADQIKTYLLNPTDAGRTAINDILKTNEYKPGSRNQEALARALEDRKVDGLLVKDRLLAEAGNYDNGDMGITATRITEIARDRSGADPLKSLAASTAMRRFQDIDKANGTNMIYYDRLSSDEIKKYSENQETNLGVTPRPAGDTTVGAVTNPVDTTISTNIGRDVQTLATSVQGLLANPTDTALQASINETLKKPEYAPGTPKHTALMTELEKRGADGRLIQQKLANDWGNWGSGNALNSWLGFGNTKADMTTASTDMTDPTKALAATLALRNFAKINQGEHMSDRLDANEIEAYAQRENAALNLSSNGARTDSSLRAANNSRDVLANPDVFYSANIDTVNNALKAAGNLDDPAARRRVADAMRDRGLHAKLVERAFRDSGEVSSADLERIANDRNAPPAQRVAAEIAKANLTEIQKADNFTNWDAENFFRWDGRGMNASERQAWADSQVVAAAPLRRTETPVDKSADAIRALTLGIVDSTTQPAERQRLEKVATDSLRNWFPVGTAPNTNIEDLAKGVTKADVDTLLATNWDKMFPGKTNFTRQDLARLASDSNPLTRATAQLAARQYASTLTTDTATIEKSAVAPASVESLVASETQRDQRRGVVKSMALTETAESLKAKMFSGTFDTTKPDVSKPRAEAMAALLRQANKDVPETGRQNPVNIDVDLGDGKKTRMQLTRERIGPDNWMIAAFVNGKPVMRAIDTQGDIFQQSEKIGSQTREVRMFEDRFKDMKAYQPPEAVTANPVVTTGDVVTDANAAMSDRAKALHAMDNGATVTVTVNGKDVQATVVKKGTWVGLMMPATDGKKPGFILKADVRRDGKVTPDGGQWTQNSWRDTGPEKWSYR
jgi:hypothetical protein